MSRCSECGECGQISLFRCSFHPAITHEPAVRIPAEHMMCEGVSALYGDQGAR
jgi:hypothetical protein